MSTYKDQLRGYLAPINLSAPKILSIGGQEDDRAYFKSVECDQWDSLDIDKQFRPTYVWDMNKPIIGGDELEVPEELVNGYDLVLALNLFEYIYDPVTALKNIVDMLAANGELIANFPFVYPVHRPEGMDMLRYTPEGVEKLCQVVGLKIERHDYITDMEDGLRRFYFSQGLKARQGFNHKIMGSIIRARKG